MSLFQNAPNMSKCEADVWAELYKQRACPHFAKTVVDELTGDPEARRRHQALFLSARSTLQRHERHVATWKVIGRAVGFCVCTPIKCVSWIAGRLGTVAASMGEAARAEAGVESLKTVAEGDIQLARQLVDFFDKHPEAQDEIQAVYKHVLEMVVGAGDPDDAQLKRRVAVR